MRKAQFMALVPPKLLCRLDALRIVMSVSRAEVNRQMIERVIRWFEEKEHFRLERLALLAAAAGMPLDDYVQSVVKGRQTVPTLEMLEDAQSASARTAGSP